ncbi:glycosyltransferase family 2 protein [uncultured Ilyobacter sp.]|uniref:glycosyltransferase family 2 protein n=1 Tax=uncultured Ilyobacter sp. TaxID=544433 RepID=UPI002AA72ACC|nr:glycosyltransferase family 2 protein [uncultured Ilyobacter sp.]
MEKILVIENSDIDYKNILGIYDTKIIKVKEENKEGSFVPDLLIVELTGIEETIDIINSYREDQGSLPVLIVADYSQIFYSEYFKKLKGHGQARIIQSGNHSYNKMMEVIESLLHPEYTHESSKISFVVPLYNEEARFKNVLDFTLKLNGYIEKCYPNSKIYFVNDGSEDNTKELVEKLVSNIRLKSDYVSDFGMLDLKDLDKNTRKAGTYIEGMKNIQGDIAVLVDGDDSFFIEDISKMINIIREGYYDMVVGTKDFSSENRPLIRKIMSFFKRFLTKFLLPNGVYDAQTGLKVIKNDSIRWLLPYLTTRRELAIDLEILHLSKKFNLRVLQLPVKCIDRDGSHMNLIKDSIKYLKSIVNIYFDNLKVQRKGG